MIVIDGSALALAVADTSSRGEAVRRLLLGGSAAPHLVDAEVGQAVRGLVLRGRLSSTDAVRSLTRAEELVSDRYAHPPLRPRAWELRDNVSFYDGLYVALAEVLGVALVTADAKLGRAQGPRCSIDCV